MLLHEVSAFGDAHCRQAGGVVGGTLYSDALAPAGQPGDSYIGLFRYNVPALVAAMAKN